MFILQGFMKLFVFDLDFTIWDAGGTWCDCTYPPYQKKGNDIIDVDGRMISMYPDILKILLKLSESNKMISAASRTNAPDIADQLMKMFDIHHYFHHPQIYPGSKVSHFKIIQQNFNIDYSQMVFFDDEYRNIDEVSKLGVTCEFLEDGGVHWRHVEPYL